MSDNEGEITITFGDEVYRGNYVKDLQISEFDINSCLVTQPALYVFWSKMAAIARTIYDKAKFDLEKYEAQLYSYLKSEKENRGEKVTEKQLESLVRLDPRRQELFNTMLRARLQYDHLNAIREAFSIRTNMLMSLSANLREEQQTSLSVYSNDNEKISLSNVKNLRKDMRAKLLVEKAEENK